MKYVKTELIKEYMKKNNLSTKQFCELSGVSQYILKKIFSGNVKFSTKYLLKICKLMKINPSKILNI